MADDDDILEAPRAIYKARELKEFEETFDLTIEERRKYYKAKKEKEDERLRKSLNEVRKITVAKIKVSNRLSRGRIRDWGGNVEHRSRKDSPGVRYDPRYKKPFIAAIDHEGTRIQLGRYATPEEASAVYQAAREMILSGEWDQC